jgi:hypothetical protein
VLSMRFDKVRSGNRAETLRAEADAQYVPPRPVHIINENLMASDSSSLGSQVSHRASLAGSEYSPELGDCFAFHSREYIIISMHTDSIFLHYGQQLCQNPRSIQKYCAYVLVLPTLFLAVFPTGDRIQWEILWFQGGGLSCSRNLNLPGDAIKVTFEWFYIL